MIDTGFHKITSEKKRVKARINEIKRDVKKNYCFFKKIFPKPIDFSVRFWYNFIRDEKIEFYGGNQNVNLHG